VSERVGHGPDSGRRARTDHVRRFTLLVAYLAACTAETPTQTTIPTAALPADAPLVDGAEDARAVTPPPALWLKGSTHVHAKPSGDSTTPIPDVIAWYEAHHYDFIVLTDHNQVSETGETSTRGSIAVRHPPAPGLIVIAGSELTHNPVGCLPPGDASGKCRIHVNGIALTERPVGKFTWAPHSAHERTVKYQAAFDRIRELGGFSQINHPQWFWGMSGELLAELASRGARLVEIANVQFPKWNAGDADHPGMEAVWDAALVKGATIWGVATDDAHDYRADGKGEYPAGGGWVVVRVAERDPKAIAAALASGQFYSSTGVELARVEVADGALHVAVAGTERHTIELFENGTRAETIVGTSAARAIPKAGYVRAAITRPDGKRAWTQPFRR